MTQTDIITDQLRAAVQQNRLTSRTGLLERAFAQLFHGLVYAQIWEDPVADMGALDIQPSDNLVCIASSSCNVMSYLTARPASITVVDLSPAHVALGRLKIAAAQHLPDHESFYAFFGRADLPENALRYRTYIADHLDSESRAYWEQRTLLRRRITYFTRGFHRFGLLGQFIATMHIVSRIAMVDYRPLLAARSLREQQQFWEDRIAPMFDTWIVRFVARRRASLFGLGIPPAQYDKLAADAGGNILPVLKERMRKLVCDYPIKDNYFAWAAFNRGYDRAEDRSVPPYLEARHFETVREEARKVMIHNISLTEMLRREPQDSKQCYLLLDAQDWMTDAQLTDLWAEITRTATPGARVLFRTGGGPDILPGRVAPDILDRWRYDAAASAKAFAEDRSAIYGGVHLYRFAG